jgi:hypothetical protein
MYDLLPSEGTFGGGPAPPSRIPNRLRKALPTEQVLRYFDRVEGVTLGGFPGQTFLSDISGHAAEPGSSEIRDEHLVHLLAFRELTYVRLCGTGITDAGLVHLAALPNLEALRLRGTHVSDKGLEHLRPLRKLRSLDLAHTAITDEGLFRLGQLESLESVDLEWTGVSREAIARFGQSHPAVTVSTGWYGEEVEDLDGGFLDFLRETFSRQAAEEEPAL